MGRKRRTSSNRKPTRSVRRPNLTGTVRLTEGGGSGRDGWKASVSGVSGRALREVMNGDIVAVSVQRRAEGGKRAVVESVLERAHAGIVGTFSLAGPLGCVRPLDTRVRADFFVLPSDGSPTRCGVKEGDVVSARIVSYPTRLESGTVTIERRLGGADASDLGIRSIMARYDLEDGYPESAVRAAEALALDVEGALQDPLRRDVRDRFALTIDPVDARDFDDAICVARTAHGGFTLSVHIADVSHYVMWDDPIDLEARRRTTSVYLADRVLPMLPERLSNDLCSLRPGEDRLAMTVDMMLDANGALKEASIYPSVMRSRVRLSYDEAQALLDGVPGAAAEWVARAAEEGVDLVELLHCADELARLRARVRERRGAVDFDTVEVHALLDEDGEPSALTVRKRTAATGLVEEAMLLANECVAAWLARRDLVAAYRVHEQPDPERIEALKRVADVMGFQTRKLKPGVQTKDLANLLDASAHTPFCHVISHQIIRAMAKARYAPNPLGHYGLSLEDYCHFTSPIRRYPDLMVHRILKDLISGKTKGQMEKTYGGVVEDISRQSTDCEIRAMTAERRCEDCYKAEYMASRIGEQLEGVVSGVAPHGIYVELPNTVEGLVRSDMLPGEFQYDGEFYYVSGKTGQKSEWGQHANRSAAGRRIQRTNRFQGFVLYSLPGIGSVISYDIQQAMFMIK